MVGDDGLLLPEIWSVIFMRLPVKLILRCMSVRKSWYSLISDPNFISNYENLNLNKSGNRLLLELYDSRASVHSRLHSFISHDEAFVNPLEHDQDFPDQFMNHDQLVGGLRSLQVVGSCNGLICLALYKYKDSVVNFLIWNPTIRKTVELPSLAFTRQSQSKAPFYYGFGFNYKTSDHKVLFIEEMCEIFDWRKGVWRGISPTINSWFIYCRRPECYLNGYIHWFGSRSDISSEKIILAFNMSDEIFREIAMPNCAEFIDNGGDYESYVSTKCVTFDGLIYVIVWKSGVDENIDMSEGCSVWAMKEYGVVESWSKVFDIDLPSAQLWLHKFCLWGNGEVLMTHELEEEYDEEKELKQDLVSYNPESRKSKCLFSATKCIIDLCLYKESLVLL